MANPVPPHPNLLIPKYEYPGIVGIGISNHNVLPESTENDLE